PARLLLLGTSVVTVPAVAILTDSRAVMTRIVLLALALGVGIAVVIRFALAARAREAAQVALAYQATPGELTGTVNRVLLLDRIGHALARDGNREPLAVMYLDLDRFKSINDSLGHEFGDALLHIVAQRIAGTLRSADTLGRFGGDEFVLLSEGIDLDRAI